MATSISPPDAPTPETPLGCPRYSSPQPDAPFPPRAPSPRHSSLPDPTPSSEPRKTLFVRETWIAGSPALFSPQPVSPSAVDGSCPKEKFPTVTGLHAPEAIGGGAKRRWSVVRMRR